MASPFPFTSGQVLTAAQLNAIGETIDFSGSLALTSWTLGNGTVNVCKYVRVQNLVFYYGKVTLGSTSTTSGDLRVNLPVTAAAGFAENAGLARYNDVGTASYAGTCSFESTTLLNMLVSDSSSSKVQIQNVNGTNPFTWSGAAGDQFFWQIVYEAA
jgi:hypothetical protein